jgi:mercuric ion transport protein
MLTEPMTTSSERPRSFKMPIVLGGLGLLACAVCCSLPLLGAIGLAGGVAAISGVVEPLSAILLVLGAVTGVVAFIRFRRRSGSCRAPVGASCATDGGCGCASQDSSLSGSRAR